ncbi:MAG: U32 family peptidase [Bacteroidia bacterium]|nr:U32 family peptidase [Bacteroidia bacterium]
MKQIRGDIDLSAPAGSYESLMAAIQGGATSVYFGVEQLNMRAGSANNFTTRDLKQIIRLAQEYNLRTYLTLNTIIYDHEIRKMKHIIDAAKDVGINAIVATDQAAIEYIRGKNIELHLSTQLNISNFESLKFYSGYADVVVLARELTLQQVAGIARKIKKQKLRGPSGNLMKLEIFIHGALCMAVSGKCYLSLHESNNSANRGICLQTCRKGYIVTEKESNYQLEIDNEYIMSPKDLCTIHFLDKIINAGVSVLKIEGRARSPEYVKMVTKCYREEIDSIFTGAYTPEKIAEWRERLKSVFNRGFWDGYYLGEKLGEWSNQYGSQATKTKEYIGKIKNYFTKLHVAEVLIESGELNINDEILIIGPTTGVIEMNITEIRTDLLPVQTAVKSQICSIPVQAFVRRSDKLYKLIIKI